MRYIKKIIRKIQEGALREILQELKWIYRYGLRYKGSILWYIVLGVFGIVTGLGGSILSKYVIDAITGYHAERLLTAVIAYVVLQLVMIGCRSWSRIVSEKIVIKVDQEIRADVYDKILDADWEALSQYHSGDLLNRVDNDVSRVSGSVLGWLPDLVTHLLQFAGTLGILVYYDPTLAVLALLSAPVTILISKRVTKGIRDYSKNIEKVSSDVMIFNEESFQNVQLIKSFGLAESYKKKLRKVQETYKNIRLDYTRFQVFSTSGMSLMGSVVAMICFAWGVYRLWTGYITYGTMTLFLQLSSSLSGAFSALVHMIPSAITAATSAGRLMSVTELPKETYVCEEEAASWIQNHKKVTIQGKDLGFRYQSGKQVLQQASFLARPGEIVAIVGPSGGGKTTMLRILLGLVSINQGDLYIRNESSNTELPISAATRSLFSYVPQENVMFNGSVAENLRLLNEEADEEAMNEALRKACAYDFVHNRSKGLESPILENGGGFSEGQIQRLAIARALLSKAPVLLLDEATSALDVRTERKILKNILHSSDNKTCIITTHRPSVLSMCDRIYRISDCKMEVMSAEEIETMIMEF